eukprot:INCI15451.1.p1 GENE.INCI15451.1~~INCI15451.1.p1  ORF type:complete len:299 (+),score=55.99 INCI15451.1:249-1145(+)
MSKARGNGNAYLTVTLPPRQREALYQVAQALGEAIAAESASFDVMSPDAIHMTFLFCGKTLAALSTSTLGRFYDRLSIYCGSTNECADDSSENNGDGETSHMLTRVADQVTRCSCKLAFDRLQLFPPGKNNLIVAIYRPEKTLTALQRAVAHVFVEASQQTGAMKSSRATAAALDEWQPHVTLGKIRASRADVGRVGSIALSKATKCTQSLLSRPILPLGVGMSGTAPPQRWMNWDLRFRDDIRHAGKSAPHDAEAAVQGSNAKTEIEPQLLPSGLGHGLPSQQSMDGQGDGGTKPSK